MLKRDVSRLSIVHFQVNYADYASLFAVELEKLLVNNKTTASCQANMSPKHCIKTVSNHIKDYKQQQKIKL